MGCMGTSSDELDADDVAEILYITGDEYRARVIASAKARDRQSGQLLNTSVPNTPLPDAKMVAREGKPRHSRELSGLAVAVTSQ